MSPKTAVIIPTYNEKDNIVTLVNGLLALKLKNAYVVIVDDNSPDGTGEVAESLAKEYRGEIKVIHRPKKLGLGTAYKDGFKEAFREGAEIIVTMDADLSHDPAKISKMLKKLRQCDVVIGSRHIEGGRIVGFKLWRKILSFIAQWFSRTLLFLTPHDSTSAFRAYKRHVLSSIKPETIKAEGYSFLIEVIFRCQRKGFKIEEIPITFVSRTKGKSKISQAEILKALITVVRLKFTPQESTR